MGGRPLLQSGDRAAQMAGAHIPLLGPDVTMKCAAGPVGGTRGLQTAAYKGRLYVCVRVCICRGRDRLQIDHSWELTVKQKASAAEGVLFSLNT